MEEQITLQDSTMQALKAMVQNELLVSFDSSEAIDDDSSAVVDINDS
jgi:hypothetical protein